MCIGVMSKKRKKRIVIVFVCIILFIALIWCLIPRKYLERPKIILFLNGENGITSKIMAGNELLLDDCREYLVDYSEEKQTILYLNEEEQIVELDIQTGMSNKKNLSELEIYPTEEQEIHNLQYGPTEDEISFVFDKCIYIWNTKTEELRKVVNPCMASIKYNKYQWCETGDLYFLRYHRNQFSDLYLFEEGKNEAELIQTNIVSFILNENEDVLYAVEGVADYEGLALNIKFQIIEINLVDGTTRELQKLKSDNFLLKNVDDRYLYYVEESANKKNAKLYCLDLESGHKKCIFRTDREIVGIIIENVNSQ